MGSTFQTPPPSTVIANTYVTCSRELHFCAGHRVLNHEGKCAKPHGHEYTLWVEAYAPTLDAVGRVVDFSVLKQRIGGWIDDTWDHKFLVYEKDAALCAALAPIGGLVVLPFNPTAENLARHLASTVCPTLLLGLGLFVTKVRLYETPRCYAEARTFAEAAR